MLKRTLQYTKGLECSFFVGTLQECLKQQITLEKQGYKTILI